MKYIFRLGVAALTICLAVLPSALQAVEINSVDLDRDQDGLSNLDETTKYFTDPDQADTDGDGYPDGEEIAYGYSPRYKITRLVDVDSDSDGLNDAWELILGTGLMNPDTDRDGHNDGTEVFEGYDPLNKEPVKVEKKIKVSATELRLRYYFGDRELESIPVSTGKEATPTPPGDFKVLQKIPVKDYIGPTWNYPDVKWSLYFTRARGYRYYIHGAYWHNKFGTAPVSGGCVNVRYADMERLYAFAQVGTSIFIGE
ncbi:MAG: L,D-transpeptidase family protein [bacterium]